MKKALCKCRFAAVLVLLTFLAALFCGCAHFSPQAVSKQFVNAVDKKNAAELADCMYWDGSVEADTEKDEFVSHMAVRFEQESYTRIQFVSYERGGQLSGEETSLLEEQYNCKIREAAHVNLRVAKTENNTSQEEYLHLIAFKVGNLWYATTDFTADTTTEVPV